jgi:hypothetical protein
MLFMTNSIDKFWNKVDKTSNPNGCWIWTGYTFKRGYGLLQLKGIKWTTHRLSYTLLKGNIPDNMYVCHTCDNPSCVRPEHLFLGTHNDNMQDRDTKGRTLKGNQNGNAKLTEQQVLEIRNLYVTTKISYKQLALRYNVSEYPISQIINRKLWKHI